MQKSFVSFLFIFLCVYGVVNSYVGLRLWQTLRHFLPAIRPLWYWPFFLLLAAIFPLGRFSERLLPQWLSNLPIVIGSYWLAMLYYLFILILLLDVLLLSSRYTGTVLKPAPYGVIISMLITTGLVGYGVWNAHSPVIQHYDVIIPKKAGDLSQLRIVMISDIHLGKFVGTTRLARLVDAVNRINPDIVLLPGDIIDEDIDFFVTEKMSGELLRLWPPLGTYSVLGNHEYIGGKPDLAIQELRKSNVNVLRDSYIKIANAFYIVGRDDRSRARTGGQRKSLREIMDGVDQTLPIIVLDHQPSDLNEPMDAGTDLQLSGHTHLGQIFPNNYITHALYEIDWGYLRKNSLQVIVSCGFGTWGPPMRIGNHPEIADITVHFVPPEEMK